MAAITILKRQAGKNSLVSVVEAADQIAISGLVRTAAGAATLYDDAFTTGLTLGRAGVPITVADELRGPSDGTGLIIGQPSAGASTGSAPQIVSMTTAERDDLVAADGMLVFNTDESALQVRRLSDWAGLVAGEDEQHIIANRVFN